MMLGLEVVVDVFVVDDEEEVEQIHLAEGQMH
jgi:hypothetical protein